jgi:hypothetical protein
VLPSRLALPTEGHSMSLVDADQIRNAKRAICSPGQVTEVRILNAAFGSGSYQFTLSGYFDDPDLLADAVADSPITSAQGFYFLPNPVNPALLARAVNKLRKCGKGDPLTSDKDIARRHWLLVDLDPVRPAGIASTDDEHIAALERATDIVKWMQSKGSPLPIIGDSGNGAHLMYRVDLPVEDGGVIQRCLATLAKHFDDDVVKVDQTCHNPARIWKLYGTMCGKGDPAAARIGRPHRMSRLISVPENLEVCPC